ncbi:MAG: DUF4271 domain-containing protein [Bacteroidota bacterium]|nr:DUF4271 domain-containing protein [Bacteroidota bacterium]
MVTGYILQDTIKPKLVIRINTDKLISDSVFRKLDETPAYLKAEALRKKKIQIPEVVITDTTSVCQRNSIADVSFYSNSEFLRNLIKYPAGQFPSQLAGKTAQVSQGPRLAIIRDLRDGRMLSERPLHFDWILGIVFLAAYLFMIVRSKTRTMLPEMARFLMFRGINETVARDMSSVFTWQSTVLNFISFMVLGLFGYCAAAFYDFIPSGIPHFVFMLLALGLVIFGITSRHFICVAAGNLSGKQEAFNEYLFNVYQSYRFSSYVIFVLVVLLLYTVFLPPQVYFIAGLAVLGIFYAYRVARLFLIFLKLNISILYLILYLCALEILPVLILLKYFTGIS